MCGIVGKIQKEGGVDAELLLRMRDAMTHRGPDDAGLWVSEDGRVGLAHRRLSIVDLTPTGHQPMTDSANESRIVFNGEIYNFTEIRSRLEAEGCRFRSRSDTEVLLEAYRAWGFDCLSRLHGMFAFAIFDPRKQLVFLARDRAGEKPLFICHRPGMFAFASELKALMADPSLPRRLEVRALEHYLAYGYVPADLCILQGFQKLPPAHSAVFHLNSGSLHIRRYWRLPTPVSISRDPEELSLELEDLLAKSVKRQMVADVPVAILLSGGVDSSLVTALAARAAPKVRTFTVAFPGHGSYDESSFARMVASHFDTDHTELAAEPASVDLLPRLAHQYDEPLGDSSLIPTYLVSNLIRRHATVALGGDGGDELFGGYPHYRWMLRQERLRPFVPRSLRQLLAEAARRLPVGFRGRNYLLGFSDDLAKSIAHVNMYFDESARSRLLAEGFPRARGPMPEGMREGIAHDGSPLSRMMATDFSLYMPDDILVKVDRASMLASLEVRAPWLDHSIIEFAFTQIPDDLRATHQRLKILPKVLARRLLPAILPLDRKQGFSIPLDSWLRGVWGTYAKELMDSAPQDLFRKTEIQRLLVGQERGLANAQRLFALMMFELWRKDYGVGLP